MVKFLILQIKMGNITIEDIPTRYKEEVIKALKEVE